MTRTPRRTPAPWLAAAALVLLPLLVRAGAALTVAPDWNDIARVSTARVSIEVCVEPPLRRAHPIHDQLFAALKGLGADAAHFQPYNVFPRLAVAELQPPADGRTYWDFSLMDPIAEDFMSATAGHSVVFNIGTLPAWIFRTREPVVLPADPDQPYWTYSEFNSVTLDASTLKLAADYQARLAGWYLNGGFRDEYGRWHGSGHHYDVEYWEVLNDPDFEGSLSPADYTKLYDAIVLAVHKVAPRLKFMGPVVGDIAHAQYFTYFLDPRNHRPAVPLDMISYHMFVLPDADESPEVMTYTFYQQADRYLLAAGYIDALRQRFIPHARTDVVDVATELPDPLAPVLATPIPRSYWSLSGGVFAYVYGKLALLGVDVVGASELIDSPGIVAASTLVDWETGRPNARYWVTRLLRENFGPGDRLVRPPSYNVLQPDPAPQIYVQAFITPQAERRILLINKRDVPFTLTVTGAAGGDIQQVDQTTDGAASRQPVAADQLNLPGLAVAVVTLPRKAGGSISR
ncbi:MAG TPA: hypothetical protein VLX90_07045 [Steroidobacteraceae bacterium]|nr:hypothetical protein [Steroidobacteraceae bacterium]